MNRFSLLAILAALLLFMPLNSRAQNYPKWLDRSVFYQIYPSSYMDSDGNGIGDIKGIISKLDYIKSVGVTAIWLNPVYESGWMDGGYDVIDYYKVDPRFGTNSDMVDLFSEAHKRGIKVIMDLVAGHTSDRNKWFLQSMESDPNQRYSDYYIWTDEISPKDKEDIAERYRQPNPKSSTIGKFVEKNAPRAKYYYKNYYEAQPALNYGFANPDPAHPWEQAVDAPGPSAVWQELRNIMVFWFDKGADGFRVDMAQSLVKNDDGFKVTSRKWKEFTAWMHANYPDNVLLAEWSDPEVSLPIGFNVDFFLPWRSATGYTKLILPEPYGKHATNYFNTAGKGEVREFVDYYTRTLKTVGKIGYMAPQTSNHDVQRPNILTRNTIDQLKVAITFFLTLKSIPFIYYGDEIGMKYNPDAPEKEGSREVFSSGFVNERSGSRTPMQWTNGRNAGFSTCAPEDLFLPVDTDGGLLTVETQEKDPSSMLNYVRKVLALRQESPAMSNTGDWEYVSDPDRPYPMVYKRFSGDELYVIALNPSGKKVKADFATLGRTDAEVFSMVGKAEYKPGKVTDRIEMGPVSAVIYKMEGSLAPVRPTGNVPVIDLSSAEDYSPFVFGHNLEHTRAAVNGGLSAQMLQNRKFAGKPSKNQGVAALWTGIGDKVLFQTGSPAYTKHICLPNMSRWNEIAAQSVQNMTDGQAAGLYQGGLLFKQGEAYEMRTVTKVSKPLTLKVELTDRTGNKVYASRSLSLEPSDDWVVSSFEMTPSAGDEEGCVRYTFDKKAEVVFGALSMMPKENFHGMRPDVVANLKAIGPRLLRWPGGNFAGEYRWKDGLLPVDQRGPLQAVTEIETQPYSLGYDFHEIDTDDFIALCREVGAEPMLTINISWNSPEESAQWVEYCNGSSDTEYGRIRAERGHKEPYNVRLWSLGNEIGYRHMEGPDGPLAYSDIAGKHADAMLEVTPGLEFCSSGPYPSDNWAENSAAILAGKVEYVSLHHYAGGSRRFTTPEDVRKSYEEITASFKGNVNLARRMRESLDATGRKLHISFDEWNQWYSWYRPSCVAEGIYAAETMHFYINESNALDIPIVCYFQPVGEGAMLITPEGSRLTANGQIFAMMKAHQDGKVCKVSGNADYSTAATLKDGILTVTLVNSSYDSDREFNFDLKGKVDEATLYSSEDVSPHSYFEESPLEVSSGSKGVKTVLPPHSAAIIKMVISR